MDFFGFQNDKGTKSTTYILLKLTKIKGLTNALFVRYNKLSFKKPFFCSFPATVQAPTANFPNSVCIVFPLVSGLTDFPVDGVIF